MGTIKTENRLGEENVNHQGCLMKIVEYNLYNNIVIEFQDEFKFRVHTRYDHFEKGDVKNPYFPSIFNVGIVGTKYPVTINGKIVKEYDIWHSMIERCFDKKIKEKCPTYKDATCCKEWLNYENFYEWLHSQPNFDKWINGERWAIDKDILVKGNKIYSPNTCCLVPYKVNGLFEKCDAIRGDLPIGVYKNRDGKFKAQCQNPITKKREYLGTHATYLSAFEKYKQYKESLIKQVAKIEYDKNNITEQCYNAMMNYEVEITD